MWSRLKQWLGMYDPEDEGMDHLAGAEEVTPIPRGKAHEQDRLRVAALVRDHPDETTASPALRAAVRRRFGTWDRAVRAAASLDRYGSVTYPE